MTHWAYPVALHEELCNILRVNPRVWIFPSSVAHFFSDHFGADDMPGLDGFADECSNICYFFRDEWSEEYRRWIVCHEMWHIAQYFDKGNIRGQRWRGLKGEKETTRVWEREAIKFANTFIGKRIDKDFKRYNE